jgi:tRNA(adenine34) deaminase
MAVKKWVAKVDTDSTHPDEGLFKKSASAIAKALASKEVSPKGPASGMRMLNYYINRGGKNLSKERHAELEKAKTILSGIIAKLKQEPEAKKIAKKTVAKKTVAKKTVAKKSGAKKPAAKKSAKAATKKSSSKRAAG